MAQPGIQVGHEIIELLSESEDEGLIADRHDVFDARSAQQDVGAWPDLDEALDDANDYFSRNHRELIDLTAIPDVDIPPSDAIIVDDENPDSAAAFRSWAGKVQSVTEDECVQLVLGILPDISVDHVLRIIKEKTTDASRTTAQCEQLLTNIIDDGVYPKEADEPKNKKRKRSDDEDFSDYEKGERDPEVTSYERDALELLKDEFLSVPVRHITNVLQEQKTLFKTFSILEEQVRNYQQVATPFSKITKSRPKRGIEFIMIERGSQLPKELHAAKRKREAETVKRHKAQEFEEAEKVNLQRAQTNNEMGECVCCFNDVPLNRMIGCNGDTVHLYCAACPRQQIETQMGQSRCRPKCFGVDDCDGTFSRAHIQLVLSERTFERLEHMQQQEDLKAAGLDFLSECPFCDFKMECPPVEVDKEFRCENKKCGKTSCRICQKETHIPLSCEEFSEQSKKDEQLTLRHIVEEAMSSALIRHCNRCQQAFIKEYGCNKMTCTHCRNVQCYVCSKNVTNYQHFGEALRGKCPLHENVEDRHEQEVKRAADEAMAKVRADNPGLSDADLMIKVSDRVKRAEDARHGRAADDANAFPYQMVGDVLRHRDEPPPIPIADGQPAEPFVPVVPPPPFLNIHPIPQPIEPEVARNMLPDRNIQWPGIEALQIRNPAPQRLPQFLPIPAQNPCHRPLPANADALRQLFNQVRAQQVHIAADQQGLARQHQQNREVLEERLDDIQALQARQMQRRAGNQQRLAQLPEENREVIQQNDFRAGRIGEARGARRERPRQDARGPVRREH